MGGIYLLSREQEKKKVFFQLGNRFNLPKELIIHLYQVLMNSIKHDMDLEINFRKNILSSHLCGPSAMSCCDMDDLFTLKNPFQFRYPIGRGNEWLIHSDGARREDIFYHGCYNQLRPRDIISQQIKIYGDYHFLLRPRIILCREYYESLEGMDRVRFIDDVGIDLFDHYWEHNEDNAFNLICQGDTYEETWLDFVEQD